MTEIRPIDANLLREKIVELWKSGDGVLGSQFGWLREINNLLDETPTIVRTEIMNY